MRIVQALAEITIYSAVIFLAILLFRRCFDKKLAPSLRYALWFVLLARLLMPVTIDGGVRLFTRPAAEVAQVAMGKRADTQAPQAEPAYADTDVGTVPALDIAAGEAAMLGADAVDDAPQRAPRMTVSQALVLVWLGGVVLCGGWMLASYLALRGRIRRHAAPPSERLAALFERAKAELGVRTRLRLVCLYEYGSPALVFPNLLWMPLNALVSMSDDEAMDALRHELTHLRRGDPLVNTLLCALCAAHWFNPAAWIAARLMREDMESACDAMVMRGRSVEQRRGYAALILSLYAQPAHRSLVLGLAARGARRQAERRVRGIFLRQRSGAAVRIAALALMLLLAFGCFTTACRPAELVSGAGASDWVELYNDTDRPIALADYVLRDDSTGLGGRPLPNAEIGPGERLVLLIDDALGDVLQTRLARIDREAEQIAEGVTLAVHADVTMPVHRENPIRRVERVEMRLSEFDALIKKLMPQVEWTKARTEMRPADSEALCSEGERDGVAYQASGQVYDGVGVSHFYCGAKDRSVVVISRSEFAWNVEMERTHGVELEDSYHSHGKELSKSIALTAAEARKSAEEALEVLGADWFTLQLAERACVFEGTRAISRGWLFLYVPDNGGLPAYYRSGRSGMSTISGERAYGEPIRSDLSIYVDETGVVRVEWRDPCVQTGAIEADAEILPYEAILERAKARLAKRYDAANRQSKRVLELTIIRVQLAAAIIGDEPVSQAEAFRSYGNRAGRLVPTWEVAVAVAAAGEEPYETVYFPFSALDGVWLLEQDVGF